jgi:hypothetical protein
LPSADLSFTFEKGDNMPLVAFIAALYIVNLAPAIVFAECAWVLWHEHTYFSPKEGRTHTWETPTAYLSKQDCESIKDGTFKIILAQAQKRTEAGGNAVLNSVPSVWISLETPLDDGNFMDWQQKLTCLPDTVSPK